VSACGVGAVAPLKAITVPVVAVTLRQSCMHPHIHCRPVQCLLPVWRTLADRPMHDGGDGRIVVPLLQPVADELPFAVAVELHTCRDGGASTAEPAACGGSAEASSFQLHYILQGQGQVSVYVHAMRLLSLNHASLQTRLCMPTTASYPRPLLAADTCGLLLA
jgi:hypothetical protein